MATFVLIHGAWHGGWCWKRVADLLRLKGHAVYTPSLTGSGDRTHLLAPTIGLDTYVNDVVNLFESYELESAVLVGHSAAGAVVAKAAESVPQRLASLALLDGVVLPSGKAMFDVFPKRWVEDMRASARERGQGWWMPPEQAMIFSFFASDFDEEDRKWIWRRVTPQPIKPYEDKVDLRRYEALALRKTYIRCTLSLGGMQRATAERLGMRYVELRAGHDAMISQPQALAAILLDLSE